MGNIQTKQYETRFEGEVDTFLLCFLLFIWSLPTTVVSLSKNFSFHSSFGSSHCERQGKSLKIHGFKAQKYQKQYRKEDKNN